MRLSFVCLFVLIASFSCVLGEDSLDAVDSGEDMENIIYEDGKFYTANFYIALGIGVFVLIVLAVLIWFFVRGPKNKWE